MANLKDVAELAGVSVMTVSRVLSGKGYVSEEKRLRVMECAQALTYRPNTIARSLVLNRTGTVGIPVCHLENPIYAQYVASISETLRRNGMDIILTSAETPRTWLNAIQTLLSKQVDGLILASLQFDGQDDVPMDRAEARALSIEMLRQSQKPYAVICNSEMLHGEEIRISPDYRLAMYMAARHLIQMGHRHIGRFCFHTPWPTRDEGFAQAMAEANLTLPDRWLFDCDFDGILAARQSALSWLDRTDELPTAVCCDNDAYAVALMQALNERGLRVPEDVSVIGNDGNVYSHCTSPLLTTVSIRPLEVGRVCAQTLLNLLKTPGQAGREIKVSPEFQPGGTVKRMNMDEPERDFPAERDPI